MASDSACRPHEDMMQLMAEGGMLIAKGGYFLTRANANTSRLESVMWCTPWQVEKLRQYVDLNIFDTTHNTNRCVTLRV